MLPARFLFVACLAGVCVSSISNHSFAQDSKPSSPGDISQLLQRQLGWDDALPDEKNPDGLHFQFVKIDDANLSQGHFVRYRAYVPGAPRDQKLSVGEWQLGSDLQVFPNDVYVNAKGLLMVHKPRPDQMDRDSVDDADELDFALQTARGEPVRFVLATSNGKLMVPGTIVPFPIESKSGACRLEIRLVTRDAEAVLIYADGLKPNSVVPFESISAGEPEQAKFSANAKGHAATADMPFVDGKDAGVLKVKLVTKGCALSADVPWGKGSYHPL
jgi:hypothetical protein